VIRINYKRRYLIVGLALGIAACDSQGTDSISAGPPATVDHEVHEEDLATVRLSPQAIERLGIETSVVEYRYLEEVRTIGGEVMAPPGRNLTVVSPAGGYVLSPGDSVSIPRPGATLAAGQTVLRILPVDSSQQTVNALEEVGVRELEAQVASDQLLRVQAMSSKGLGTQADLDAATATLARAESALRVARAQRELLMGRAGNSSEGLTSIEVVAPFSGVITKLSIAPRQSVAAGSPLFAIEERSQVWIRVPLYSGDVHKVDRAKTASVAPIADWGSAEGRQAHFVNAPISGNSASASLDIYYELDNEHNTFQPGERVSISIPLQGQGEKLTVPFSSLFRDIHDGAWVYVQVADGTYVRTRVILGDIAGDAVALESGPEPGTYVVTTGVAELVGTEFGVGH